MNNDLRYYGNPMNWENVTGDLISRSALKKALEVTQYNDIDDLTRTERLIDNAPTVEVPENTVNCVLTMFGKCSYNETGCSDCKIKDKIRKELNARPQGKWIEDIENLLYRCSNCNASSNIRMFKSNLHFCPNCGADMRGDRE